MIVKEILKKLNDTLQEILLTAEIKSNSVNNLLSSTYWEFFAEQINKWLLALKKAREGKLEEAEEILEEIYL